MFRKLLSYFTLPLLLLLGNSSGNSTPRAAQSVLGTFNPGPDAIAGDMAGLYMAGIAGSQCGLAMGITTCNAGGAFIDFFAMPNTHHPAAAQNLFRMSGGAGNNDRFEQIGQAWVKHTYGAKQANSCSLGCQPGGDFTHLGVGCSDTYFASQSAEQADLGSRAWINPFTGIFPTTARDHAGHAHSDISHMLLVESNDLNQTMNPGATYYAELLYVTPDEYAWCQTHPGECNMYNNASYRRYNAAGTTSFTFTPGGLPVRMTPALNAWTGATIHPIEPEPGVDGRAFIAYKVTGPVAGFYHYEYAIYNQNLDRAIQSFSVPLGVGFDLSPGCGLSFGNIGFHAPLNHPGFPNDGTQGDAGFSNTPWTSNPIAPEGLTWFTETMAQNPNANAIRWGTLYNFRFDSNKPPIATNATIGFFKTGTPVTVPILGPNACDGVTPTPTPGATPLPAAQAVNLSTRMRVDTGDNVGIGGVINQGPGPKRVLFRAIGPSLTQFGIANLLADPVMELHGPVGFVTITNNNWRDDPVQEALILATGIPPTNDLESAIIATLAPGEHYTAIVRGLNDTVGVAVVEVYDLDQASPSRLGNISTRAFVSTGDNIVIAGFILGNNTGNDRVIVRGIGPSIVCLGSCPSTLDNPALGLRNGNGALLRFNNDWQDDPAQAAEISAAGLAPINPVESAIVATLPPGLYTALLAGSNTGDTGLGLVEVYDLGAPPPPSTPTPTPTPSPSPGLSPSPTPSPTPPLVCAQDFDGVTPPALPPGWSGSWVTSAIDPDSPPNDAFVPNLATSGEQILVSPNINLIPSAPLGISFRNNFNTDYDPPPAEVFRDGYVLEISTDGGASYNDIIAAGGVFAFGPYTGEIDSTGSNPLAGRMAWSGNSGGYIDTVIQLPQTFIGQPVKLRFRMGTDGAGGAPGVRIDNFFVAGSQPCP